jgi:hypothetical protein
LSTGCAIAQFLEEVKNSIGAGIGPIGSDAETIANETALASCLGHGNCGSSRSNLSAITNPTADLGSVTAHEKVGTFLLWLQRGASNGGGQIVLPVSRSFGGNGVPCAY